MHTFTDNSGKTLWYNVVTNKIEAWTPEKEDVGCPMVTFLPSPSIIYNKIPMFVIEMTQQCNLRCEYCCYSGNYRDLHSHSEKEISYSTLNDAVHFIEKHTDKSAESISVCFYGGEALLVRDKIAWAINALTDIFGDRIEFSISTNGVLLTEPIIDWICRNNITVNVSVDGNEEMHDRYRKCINGIGSYNTIIRNLELFKRKYPERYEKGVRFLTTTHSWDSVEELSNVWDEESVLRGHYPVIISHVSPNFADHTRVYDSYETKDSFYRTAFEHYKQGKRDIMTHCFERLVHIVKKRKYNCLANKMYLSTCFQELFSCYINANGDLYACERCCDSLSVGNVATGFSEDKIRALINSYIERKNKFCSSCWAQRMCRMCITGLNYTDDEMSQMCNRERDTIELALKYFCELKFWERENKQSIQ